MTLRVIQVVPRVAAASSGPSVSVPALCRSLKFHGIDTRLVALEPAPEPPLSTETEFHPTANLPFAGRFGVSSSMKAALRRHAREAHVIHTNSLWMMPNIYPAAAVSGTKCRLVVSPRGTLSDWALRRARLRKRLVWWLGQGTTLRAADCLHATSDEELRQIRHQGLRNPVAVIPNGVSVPERVSSAESTSDERVVLFLARLHPTKGLDRLLQAWSQLESTAGSWTLRIAGPLDSDYSRSMIRLADDIGLKRVRFVGEQTGQQKTACFEQAELYVLPTHSENFGISVAEALAHELPVITTHGAPWSGLAQHAAGWWIDHGIDPLVETLRDAMNRSSAELRDMGRRGREWMLSEFDWNVIAGRMAAVYQWLAEDGPRPPDVRD